MLQEQLILSIDIEMTGRFVLEVAKDFGENKCEFYDKEEFNKIIKLYGDLKKFQTLGE